MTSVFVIFILLIAKDRGSVQANYRVCRGFFRMINHWLQPRWMKTKDQIMGLICNIYYPLDMALV